MYSSIVLDHFANPRHVGAMPDADGYGRLRDDSCGDVIELFIKVREGRIADVRYRTFGCAVALASSSMASDLAIGQTLAAAAAITDEALAEALGGLPEGKRHCTVLAVGALRLALEDYLARHPEAYCAQGCPCAQPC